MGEAGSESVRITTVLPPAELLVTPAALRVPIVLGRVGVGVAVFEFAAGRGPAIGGASVKNAGTGAS
jgi:hypothetical protein